jgi:hypothetical protein
MPRFKYGEDYMHKGDEYSARMLGPKKECFKCKRSEPSDGYNNELLYTDVEGNSFCDACMEYLESTNVDYALGLGCPDSL